MSYVLAGLAHALTCALVFTAGYLARLAEVLPGALWLQVLARPALLALLGWALVFSYRLASSSAPRRAGVAAALLGAGLVALHLDLFVDPRFGLRAGRALFTGLLLCAGLGPVLRRWPGVRTADHTRALALLLSLACVSGAALGSRAHLLRLNELGLVSFQPRSVRVEDWSTHAGKDRYPRTTSRYNRLGYRDEEPPARRAGRQLVLLVGDSYVWGDGIPTNEETLSYRLRERLERLAPGRFAVTSAAFPGFGAYGYGRTVEAAGRALGADVVVVGWLGGPDLDPLDVQRLREAVAGGLWSERLLVHHRVLHSAHATFQRVARQQVTPAALRDYEALLAAMGRFPRALFLDFSGDLERQPPPQGVEALVVPAALRYPGHRTPLWYARDCHPRPPLVERLAALLADALLRPAAHRGRAAPPAP